MTGVAKKTIVKLLAEVGEACSNYQDKVLKNFPCKNIQCDEIWSFCYAKEKNVPKEKRGKFGYGDVWTWTAICADTKLIPSWFIGNRDSEAATIFINDLASRLAHRVQLTTDGHRAYLTAVEDAFGGDIDYAMLHKLYESNPEKETRYSPAKCNGTEKKSICGSPDLKKVSTSYAERQNLTMRMTMRRFTRLTNAFSKKVENLAHAVSLHFMYYNFCRIHQTLRVTPAMEAGITDHIWALEEIVNLI
jgi:IS1 family transposase